MASATVLSPPRLVGVRALGGLPVVRFLCVGVGSTALHLGLFAALSPALPSSQAANVVALGLATVANTAVNRRWTFGVVDSRRVLLQHLQAFVLFSLTWAMSAGALWLLDTQATHPPVLVQTVVVGAAMAVSTVFRYVGMRTWIFARR